MCGLTGFIHQERSITENDLQKMASTMEKRGPDDEGYYLTGSGDFQLGMAFRRLSILDLSKAGHQPMFFKNLVITLNGEIYNFREIREELKKYGYIFESGSDTEVVLKAFHRWGTEMLSRFIGMFAIALFDKDTNELFLLRDRIGIKPLYYYSTGKDLVYASELKPILAYPFFPKEINFNSLSKYLYHGYISGSDSIFTKVCKLEPGTYLKFSNGHTEIIRYWDLKAQFLKNSKDKILDEEECLNQLEDLLTSSVRYRMIADVPIGSFLSGGIDSSLTTSIMQKLSGRPVNTFTIGFEDEQFNEALNAKAISKYLGTNHHELTLPVSKAKELIEKLPDYYDEPFGDSSALPTILVSQLAKKNATVVLSGDGGDELFCGYKYYEFANKMSKFKALGKILNIIPEHFDLAGKLFSLNPRFGRYPYLNSNINIINVNYLLSRYFLADIFLNQQYTIDNRYFNLKDLSENIQELYMLNDMVSYLPDDILTKVDRASMSVSLEARVPVLDHRIVEFSFKVPHDLKYHNGISKYLLKKLAYKYLPEQLLDRPKQGFAVPVFKWLKNDLHYLTESYMSESYLKSQNIFNHTSISKLLRQFQNSDNLWVTGNYLWNILMFQLWYEKYMKPV